LLAEFQNNSSKFVEFLELHSNKNRKLISDSFNNFVREIKEVYRDTDKSSWPFIYRPKTRTRTNELTRSDEATGIGGRLRTLTRSKHQRHPRRSKHPRRSRRPRRSRTPRYLRNPRRSRKPKRN